MLTIGPEVTGTATADGGNGIVVDVATD